MTTYQDYLHEMQDRTRAVSHMREVSSSLVVARPEGRRYSRLLARLGSLMETVGRELQAPKMADGHTDSISVA